MKQQVEAEIQAITTAAFGRLSVETKMMKTAHNVLKPAAFGRLSVETAW